MSLRMAPSKTPRVAVSACLLGHQVRYDGAHKKEDWLLEILSPYAELVPVCPEMEMGLGVPRDIIGLVKNSKLSTGELRLIVHRTGADLTSRAHASANNLIAVLGDFHGAILKKNSPSCGLRAVQVAIDPALPERFVSYDGQGVFAYSLVTHFPRLPIGEEADLRDRAFRRCWVARVFAMHRQLSGCPELEDLQKDGKLCDELLARVCPEQLRELL